MFLGYGRILVCFVGLCTKWALAIGLEVEMRDIVSFDATTSLEYQVTRPS